MYKDYDFFVFEDCYIKKKYDIEKYIVEIK